MSIPNVAIIGAGLGGLALAAILHKGGFQAVTVYERDESRHVRAHLGGTLDLHAESGLAAMKAAGLYEKFQAAARMEGESTIVTDKTGVPLYEDIPKPGTKNGRPEIDRTVLRDILIDSLPEDWIQWNHRLTDVLHDEDGQCHLTFANGHKSTCALLVGADGARSRVRPLVSSAEAYYGGITGAEVSLAPGTAPEIAAKVGNGTMFAVDAPGLSLISQRNGDGRIRTYAFFKNDTPDVFDIPEGAAFDPEVLLKDLEARYEGWAPWLRELISRADRSAVYPRALFILPLEHNWPHKKGVTLLGDAANLMSPFAGEGANTAMRSAMELAQGLIKVGSARHWDAAVIKYEKARFKYASSAAKESQEHLEWAYQADAAKKYAEFFGSMSTISGQMKFALVMVKRWFFG